MEIIMNQNGQKEVKENSFFYFEFKKKIIGGEISSVI